MVFVILVTLVFVPVLIKSQDGNPKVYILAQQACVLINFGLAVALSFSKSKTDWLHNFALYVPPEDGISMKNVKLLNSILDIFGLSEDEKEAKRVKHDDLFDRSNGWSGMTIQQILLLESSLGMIKCLSQYMYYFLSLMQSYDVYVMVCKPFDYAEFTKKCNVAKYFIGGLAFCFVIACDSFANLAFEIFLAIQGTLDGQTSRERYFNLHENVRYGMGIFGIVKLIMLKLAYSVAVVRMAWLTRESLVRSSKISKLNRGLHHHLFYFSLIPLFGSVLFTGHELMISLKMVKWIKVSDFIIICIQSSIVAFGSLFHFFGYILVFPLVRKKIMCQSSNKCTYTHASQVANKHAHRRSEQQTNCWTDK